MEPQDVNIKSTENPIPVEIQQPLSNPKEQILVNKADNQTLQPTTTHEEDINTASQRRVNLIWEHTQAAIAICVTGCAMIGGVVTLIATVFYNRPDAQVPTILSLAFGTVIGFYFSRTNHAAIGGIGKKPIQKYEGR